MQAKTTAPTPRQRRHTEMLAGEVHPKHGTRGTYSNYGCRCDACCTASKKISRHYYEKRASSYRDHITTGPLRDILEAAKRESCLNFDDLSVLERRSDPYRLDTPAGHRDG